MKAARPAKISWPRLSAGTDTSAKAVSVPLFFWPAFFLINLAAVLGTDLSGSAQLSLAAALIIIGGLPHGAYDIALAQETLRLKWQSAALLLGAYIAVAAFMLALWSWAPIAALSVFLIFSAVHFGDDWQMLDAGLLRAMAGASVLCVAAFFHPDAVTDLFVLMAGEGAEWVRRVLVAFTPVALLVTCVGMWQAVMASNRGWTLAHITALIGLAYLPPQFGFLLYFVFLHSPLHMRGINSRLPHWSAAKIWIYGGLICAICFAAALVFAPAFFFGSAREMSAEAFRILSVVAAPHLLLTHAVDKLKRA